MDINTLVMDPAVDIIAGQVVANREDQAFLAHADDVVGYRGRSIG